MKKQLFSIAGGALMLFTASCTEKGPAIDFSLADAKDTTYMLPAAPTAETRRVLVEEATGVACVNCPAGAKILSDYEDLHPGSLIVLGLHFGGLTDPLKESKYDFRMDYAGQLYNFLGGEPNKPSAAFDRIQDGGVYFIDKGKWPNMINQRVLVAAPVNLSVTSQYDEGTKQVVVHVKAIYTAQTTKKQALTIALTEDDIVDAQELAANGDSIRIHGKTYHAVDGVIEDYDHNHVLRDMISPVFGNAVLDSLAQKTPGRVFEKTIVYKLPENASTWNLNNVNVVVFISNNESDSKEVLQAAETKLK